MTKQSEQSEKLSARTKIVAAFAILFILTFLIGGVSFVACRSVKNAIENQRSADTATQAQSTVTVGSE